MIPIGGEFPLHPRAPRSRRNLEGVLRNLAGSQPLVLLASGREAVRHWLRGEQRAGRSTLLLPSYVCASVVQAARTEAGWSLTFLPVERDLSLVPQAVVEAARKHGPRASLLAMPLFGRPYPATTEAAIESARQLGVGIAWDITHGLLSPWSTTHKPWVASLRKWCGIVDGGAAALGDSAANTPRPLDELDVFFQLRLRGLRAKRQQLNAERSDRDFLEPLENAEADLDAELGVRGMSRDSRHRLKAVDAGVARLRRAANADRLLEVLDRDFVQPLYAEADHTNVPFGVPVLVDDRDAVRLALRARRIYCPVHWILPPEVDPERFQTAHEIAERVLTIPCDERYTPDHMEFVAAALGEAIIARA